MKLKLYRDKVISVVRGRDLVGVYVKIEEEIRNIDGLVSELLLAEMPPEKADAIIKLWNSN